MQKTITLLSLSGGLDSATLLADLLSQGKEVKCVGFTYGSKHNTYENTAAERITTHYKIPFMLLDLTSTMKNFESDLLKTGGEIPEEHYSDLFMSRTVVPGRNMIMISILAGLAWSKKANFVALGIHRGDHAIYPDCKPEFFNAMAGAVYQGTDKKIELKAPYLFMTKIDIVRRGLKLNVPYELTRTCYKDQQIPCGKCSACVERAEAFKKNNTDDPVQT